MVVMGSKPKAPVIVVPPAATPAEPLPPAATPPPAPQPNPAMQDGATTQKGNAASRMAAGFGMNNTVLTGPRGVAAAPADNRRGSLLGL